MPAPEAIPLRGNRVQILHSDCENEGEPGLRRVEASGARLCFIGEMCLGIEPRAQRVWNQTQLH